ncbi:hypothetical protein [Confluentibacter sediminis]|uniref:hypothetical protein n=1 Tax=Confluentibacter sediminis TaxID=2219045 RepID=UPI0013A6F053|nr:hypothetical protein [Confluentibacter sediminis]
MKRIILILILVVFSVSCGNDSKKTDSSAGNNTQVEEHEKELSIDSKDLKELLSKTTLLTEAEFKEVFPKSIRGLALDDEVEIINQQGYAEYGNGKITLAIHDCAGKNSGMATMFGTAYNIKKHDVDDIKYSNQKRDAIKTINTYRANRNQSDIVFLHNNRWYVNLSGKTMNPDELWEAFDLNALKNFK